MGQLDKTEKLERETERIERDDGLTGRDKELLLGFKRDMKIRGISDAWIHKVFTTMRPMAERLEGTDLEEASEEDLKGLIEWVEGRDLSEATKRDYRKILKRFYGWMNGGDHPERVQWISTARRRRNRKLPEKMLTEGDVERMIRAAKNPRDRAFVALLWETGARIGEIIDLEVGNFEEHRYGMKVVIDGKTGARRLLLISSLPHLNDWLSKHPGGGNPEAPLWVRLNGDWRNGRVSYRYLRKALGEIAERAGVDKPSNPHHFRHSRATYMASRMKEAQMCEWFGWVQGSKQPARYIHLSGREIDSTYARMHGKKTKGQAEKAELSPVECPRCKEENEPRAKFCQRCGLVLDRQASLELKKNEDFAGSVVSEMEGMEASGSLEEMIDRAVKREVKKMINEVLIERTRSD